MKAIVIVELPDDADLSKLIANMNIEKIRDCGYDYEHYTFRLHCPLRQLPQKYEYYDLNEQPEEILTNYEARGWNDCLDEIAGETND